MLFVVFFFALIPFFPFLIFLLQWLTFYWACFPFKNFQESIVETGNFCHVVTTCNGKKILLWVFHSNFWAFSCIFQAPLSQSLWSGYHWKDLFFLQKLSIDGGHQCWSKVMTSEVKQRPRLIIFFSIFYPFYFRFSISPFLVFNLSGMYKESGECRYYQTTSGVGDKCEQ